MRVHASAVAFILALPALALGECGAPSGDVSVRNDSDMWVAAAIQHPNGAVVAGWASVPPHGTVFVGDVRLGGDAYRLLLADDGCAELFSQTVQPGGQTALVAADGSVQVTEGRPDISPISHPRANCRSAVDGLWAGNTSGSAIVIQTSPQAGDVAPLVFLVAPGEYGWLSYRDDVELGLRFLVYDDQCKLLRVVEIPSGPGTSGIVVDSRRQVSVDTAEEVTFPAVPLAYEPPEPCATLLGE